MNFNSIFTYLCLIIFAFHSYADNTQTTITNNSSQQISVSCTSGSNVVLNPSNELSCKEGIVNPVITNLGNSTIMRVCTQENISFNSAYISSQQSSSCLYKSYDINVADLSNNIASLVKDDISVKCNDGETQQLTITSPITCANTESSNVVLYNNSDHDLNLICLFGNSLSGSILPFKKNTSLSCNGDNILELVAPNILDHEQISNFINSYFKK